MILYLVNNNNFTLKKNLSISYYNVLDYNLLISNFFNKKKFIETEIISPTKANKM